MTLILSVISPRWAMQASDRTVTELNAAGEVLGYQDERNKAIFVAERMTFAYTGHADIGGADTADWFQAQLARNMSRGQSVDAALDEVAEMATQYFRALPPHVADRQHAFVGVGWTEGDVDARQPFVVCLSNSISNDGAWLPTAQDNFQRYEETLPGSLGFSLFVAGAPVRDEAIGYLSARIASHLDGSDDAAPVARMLIEAIREEAQSNRSIGEGVMVNSLPIAPGPPTGDVMLVGGMPERDVRTFTYVRHGGWDGRYLGPLVVSSDGSQMGDFVSSGRDITPEGGSFGMSYRPASAPLPPRAVVGQRVREYKFRRNDPCWCASGKKYKKCHGA